MSGFDAVEGIWFERLGSLRNVVRQHAIREQRRDHTDEVESVLDVGWGPGRRRLRRSASCRRRG